ncbi:MAG TPA: tripartite tricarboxylate transporter substrate binding protein [Xanthobacteraceae bacterium]|nr:tripartite tricarboxylate transporter substrate binding protein [Xanthobacteraceae bacterium]
MVHRSGLSAACLLALVGALVLFPSLGSRGAQAAYPERYITIICASGAGGIVDVTTRILAEHMSRTLGRSVVVQNEPGAGSTLAIAAVAKAPPDGYTVLTIGPGVSVTAELYPDVGVDARRDLQPVSVMGAAPLVLLTHKDVPVTDYASLVAYLKAHPGELTTGSNGRGSAGHLAGALFKSMAGVDIRYIPYRTTPQAQTDLIGGRLSMMWLSTLTDHIQAGTLHPIAVTTLERWNQFPDTPTFDELGLKGYEATTWISMYLPKGAPREITDKLTAALDAALADPSLRERLDQVGIIAPRMTGPEFLEKYLNLEIDKWAEILRSNKDAD